jgi:hypothetical protein
LLSTHSEKLLPTIAGEHNAIGKLTRINASARAMNDIFVTRHDEGK